MIDRRPGRTRDFRAQARDTPVVTSGTTPSGACHGAASPGHPMTTVTTPPPSPAPPPVAAGRLSIPLPTGPQAPSHARRATAGFLHRSWPSLTQERCDDFLLIVSELVTNAVRHARGPSTLTLTTASGALDIAVTDRSRALPAPRTPDLRDGTGGMGLHIAEDLGGRVFTEALSGGKCVHAAFAVA
ncbi:ATP-binding protein [Streptomyces sp. NBC_01341]|uniref:ATP-binding protein n=1 Tax=Streptomyces sp. NBC_01341 TaxID=2903831 RepID=UPI002E137404|nr:ATP-binding protein [Streptomyces sp. NBC_01341]